MYLKRTQKIGKKHIEENKCINNLKKDKRIKNKKINKTWK
jgi:hypothetical protein